MLARAFDVAAAISLAAIRPVQAQGMEAMLTNLRPFALHQLIE
jgi:hypothetical protein